MKKLSALLFIILIVGCFLAATPVLAEGGGGGAAEDDSSPSPADDDDDSSSGGSVNTSGLDPMAKATVPQIIGNAIKALLSIIGAIVLFTFVYGGMLILTSVGNPDKVKKGKDVLIWSVIGLAIIFASYLLVNFIIAGLTDTEPKGGTGSSVSPNP